MSDRRERWKTTGQILGLRARAWAFFVFGAVGLALILYGAYDMFLWSTLSAGAETSLPAPPFRFNRVTDFLIIGAGIVLAGLVAR